MIWEQSRKLLYYLYYFFIIYYFFHMREQGRNTKVFDPDFFLTYPTYMNSSEISGYFRTEFSRMWEAGVFQW